MVPLPAGIYQVVLIFMHAMVVTFLWQHGTARLPPALTELSISAVGNLNQTFGNFTWNTPSQAINFSFAGGVNNYQW